MAHADTSSSPWHFVGLHNFDRYSDLKVKLFLLIHIARQYFGSFVVNTILATLCDVMQDWLDVMNHSIHTRVCVCKVNLHYSPRVGLSLKKVSSAPHRTNRLRIVLVCVSCQSTNLLYTRSHMIKLIVKCDGMKWNLFGTDRARSCVWMSEMWNSLQFVALHTFSGWGERERERK